MLVSYPNLRYLSACSLPIRVRVDAWELPTHGRGDQSQHLTAVLHKLCSGLQPGRGTKLSPLSLLAAKTGQNSPCMHQTAQNARILASRANFVTRAPQTGHAGRILSRKTLRSGNAGRVPSRLQLRGRTLTSVCAHKTLDIDVGSTAHTHIIGPTCRSSGPRVPGAHTQGATQYSQERDTRNQLKLRLPAQQSRKVTAKPTHFVLYPRGPRRERVDTLGMKKALPKECFLKTQNPHRWIAPRGAAARPKGLEPPTF